MSARFNGRPRSPMRWAATVGSMVECETAVYATCTRCHWTVKPLPLQPIIDKLGPDFSLWDQRPPCRQPGCEGRVLFMASPGAGTPYFPCKSV